MAKANGFLTIEKAMGTKEAPKKRILHFNEFTKALSRDQQACQGQRCMDCGVPFCQSGQIVEGALIGCPLQNLIPEWNGFVASNHYEHAFYRLIKTNNFPEFTSRVCPALCQGSCMNGLYGDPVTIRENEYAIIENAFEKGFVTAKIPKKYLDKKVAIVGSGPAGLAAADELNQLGYQVTVYEKEDRLGGLLMYGIPNMKLEKSIINRRITLMEASGIKFVVNHPIETKEKVHALKAHYDHIVLACGSAKPRAIEVENNDATGIYYAVDYLKNITKSLLDHNLKAKTFIETKDKVVLVIGGGDTGNDCVGTAIRLGCKDVIQLEMMPELPRERASNNPWPTWPRVKKIDYGQQESIAVFNKDPRLYLTTVEKFIKDENNQVTGAIIVNLKQVETKNGFKFEKVPGSQKEIAVDLVLISAGFVGASDDVCQAFEVEVDQFGRVVQDDFKTTQDKIYVAGDMKRGQSLIVWAIDEGRKVAQAIAKQ